MSAPIDRERVLLVDDEPQVLVALEDLLSEDFVILKTASPEEALNVARTEPDIAVIVTDQRMPQMTGDELLSKLDEKSQASRILVTGYADLTAVVRAVNDGRIFAYVSKPWQPEDLRLKVQLAAEHFRLARELADERRFLRELIDNVPDGIFLKDANLRYLHVNRPLAALINRGDAAGVIGRTLSELSRSSEVEETEAEERRVLSSGEPILDVEREYRSAGLGRWFSESKTPLRSASGEAVGLVGITRDVTLRKAHQSRIARLTRVQALTSGVNAVIVRTRDRDELLRNACRIAVDTGELTLSIVHEIDAASFSLRLLCAEPSDHPFARMVEHYSNPDDPLLAKIIGLKQPNVCNEIATTPDFPSKKDLLRLGFRSFAALPLVVSGAPSVLVTFLSSHPGFFDGDETRLLRELADNLSFALENIGTSQRLDFLAYHDGLTGLPNRELLLDRANRLLGTCRRDGRTLAVVLVDIGRFRQVNETLGRRAGDELLVLVAERLQSVPGDEGTLARFDSNTFAVLLPPVENASVIAGVVENDILAHFRNSFVVDGTELRISARVGIALFPSDGDSPETLLANAETALKKAKGSGQQYLFYAPTMNARVAEQLSLETKLRRAVEGDEFLLHYQPKVELKTGAIIGLEALIRWNDPATGLVPPGKFIPVLEETGLIRTVGAWVMEDAARQYREWKLRGLNPPRIAVNVSALQLAARDFSTDIERTLRRYPDESAGVDLEITESVFVDDLAGSIEKLAKARDRGMSVAIDDFGTGYSSLSYLGRLPIDALKIDRSFVVRMADDPQNTSIVTTIISLAHSLDLKVVAEGVETTEQARLLRLLKCDQAQGYLVARPMPASEVVKLFDSRFNMSEPTKP